MEDVNHAKVLSPLPITHVLFKAAQLTMKMDAQNATLNSFQIIMSVKFLPVNPLTAIIPASDAFKDINSIAIANAFNQILSAKEETLSITVFNAKLIIT